MPETVKVVSAASAPAPLRGRIPVVPPAHAQALRTFFSAPHSWLLADHGLVMFMPGRPGAADEIFELDAEGTRIGVRLQATAAAIGEGLHWSEFSGSSRILAWSLAHENQLMRLSEALGVALTPLLEADAGEDPVDAALWLDFLIDDEPPAEDPDAARRAPGLHGSLRLPAEWLPRLLTRAEPPFEGQTPPRLGRWSKIPASVSLQFAIPPLTPADWAGLTPGAVFVVGRGGRRPAFQAHACGQSWPLAPTGAGWRIEGPAQPIPRMHEDSTMTDTPSEAVADGDQGEAAAPPPDPEAAVRGLPAQVVFEIGRLEMPVGKLAELQPGYVFPVPAQLEGANVTIRANGEAVGQGELVSVGDTLGVRLLSWK